jgi:hypothetical protein
LTEVLNDSSDVLVMYNGGVPMLHKSKARDIIILFDVNRAPRGRDTYPI